MKSAKPEGTQEYINRADTILAKAGAVGKKGGKAKKGRNPFKSLPKAIGKF